MYTDKLVEDLNSLLSELELKEGKSFDPGTKRVWGGNEYVKQRSGKWKKTGKGGKKNKEATGAAPERVKVKPTIKDLESKIGAKLPDPPDFDHQVKIAQEIIDKHAGSLDAKLSALKELAPPGASVKGRVKDLESTVGKIARKPKYGTASKLQDVTGTRLIMDTIDEVKDTVDRIKAKYDIVEEDDYISKALDGYRSHHLIAKDENGLEFEIQVRTKNQNTWADWAHPIYKPENPAQEQAMADSAAEISDFKLRMSAFYYAQDDPKVPRVSKPKCPKFIETSFGCP